MKDTEFITPVESMTGRVVKKDKEGVIFRRKIYRDDTGKIIKKGRKEHYIQVNPRNYKANPMTPAEQRSVTTFQQALAQYKIEKEDPERMVYWKARFNAQIRKPDPEAPIDKKTGKRRIYGKVDTFIRAILYIKLKQNTTTPVND